MERVAILAITKNGIEIGLKLKKLYPNWEVYAPNKFSNSNSQINWFEESSTQKIAELFSVNEALICLFSLGAVIRLLAPHLKDKKTDPAVIVIDDKCNFVISVLSGHLGGANQLTQDIADKIGAISVITTAADVNKTISVDLVGREFGWEIDDDTTVTRVSALMVNEEKIAVYQDSGEKNWWKKEFPKNVIEYHTLEELILSRARGFLIISDRVLDLEILNDAVIYRPKTLVVGIGLHWDTTKEKIESELISCFKKYALSIKSIAKFATMKKPTDVKGLIELSEKFRVPIEYIDKNELAKIEAPNPSNTVKNFEGTASVSEASAIFASKGKLIVEKQKFPPDLTIAVARMLK